MQELKVLSRLKIHQYEEANSIQIAYLLGRRITLATAESILECIKLAVANNRRITCANFNINSFNLSIQLPWYYEFLQRAEIAHCDGSGILMSFGLLGVQVPRKYRVSYTKLLPEVLNLCDRHSLSLYLLGASEKNLNLALKNIREFYPNINVSGRHGYFNLDDVEENRKVVKSINEVKPHILLVGMGMPRQENWVIRYREFLHTNAILLGGAAIDRLAGDVEDCPSFISDIGLEWLFRLAREPRRLANRYLIGNPAFLLQIALAKASQRKSNPRRRTLKDSVKDFGLVIGNKISCADCVNSVTATMDIRSLDNSTNNSDSRLGSRLLSACIISSKDLDTALSEQGKTGVRLGDILVNSGIVNREVLESIIENNK